MGTVPPGSPLSRLLNKQLYLMGARVPIVVALLIGLTLGGSILGAVGRRNGFPVVLQWGVLAPDLVWAGQLWRLLSWPFFETDGLALIFACLALWWFGRDLSYSFGPAGFLARYLALAVLVGAGTCLLARFVFPGSAAVFMGGWPMVDAMIVAWAIFYPHRQILMFFVLPLGGRNLVYATLGVVALFALLEGFVRFVPHFLALGITLAYMRDPSLMYLWLRLKLAWLQRGGRRRSSRLRAVEGDPTRRSPWLH
jgi:membrane associated rhomboid family serine protease